MCTVFAETLYRLMGVDEGRRFGLLSRLISIGGRLGKALSNHADKRLRRELGVSERFVMVTRGLEASGWKGSRTSVGGSRRVELPSDECGWWVVFGSGTEMEVSNHERPAFSVTRSDSNVLS